MSQREIKMKFSDIPQITSPGNYEVNVGWDYLEGWLTSMSETSPLQLEPDFQRGHVWTQQQQQRYVEFVLRGGRSSRTLYWNCTTWDTSWNTPLQLVDGLQRLTAVRRFMHDRIPAFGLHKSEFQGKLRLAGPDFLMNINKLSTRAAVLQWYLDLNDGGVVHDEAELSRVRKFLVDEIGV